MVTSIGIAVVAAGCTGVRAVNPILPYQTAGVIAAASGSSSGDAIRRAPLTITTSAHVVFEPAQVVVTARVEPDARNRQLTIEWWTDEGAGGSHSISLEGDNAAIRHGCTINRLVAGEYLVAAVLTRNDGTKVRQSTKLIVAGEGSRLDAGSGGALAGR
jgi:hypothetical protein